MLIVSEGYPRLSLLTTVLWGVARQTVGHTVQWRANCNGWGTDVNQVNPLDLFLWPQHAQSQTNWKTVENFRLKSKNRTHY